MNPYEAPRAEIPASSFEQMYAKRTLAVRDRDISAGIFYGLMVKKYLVLLTFIGLGIAYFVWLKIHPGIFFLAGMAAGALLRDYGIFRAQRKAWKVGRRLIDWVKVERMAAGELVE